MSLMRIMMMVGAMITYAVGIFYGFTGRYDAGAFFLIWSVSLEIGARTNDWEK